MASPIVYSWQDANAPVYLKTAASFQALLTACLVDGYTGKAAAGWSKPFSDASSFVLKQGASVANPTAPQQCIKLYDYQVTSSQPYCSFEVAEDFTDLNTSINPWAGNETNDWFSTGYAYTTSYEVPWMIFATSRAVYFWFGYNTSTPSGSPVLFDNTASATRQYTFHEFFGDIVTPYSGFLYNQMITYHDGSSETPATGSNSLTGDDSTGYEIKRCASVGLNSIGSDIIYLNYLVKVGYALSYPGSSTYIDGVPKYPNQIDGGLYLDKVRLTSTNAYMGELPGLLYSLGSQAFNKNGIIYQIDGTGVYAGETIYTLSGSDGQLFLRDGDWGVE